MVIGPQFAWAHMGKTGGDAVHVFFSVFQSKLGLEIDSTGENAKHDPFHRRMERIRGKDLWLNIRRLPSYLLSQLQHRNTAKPPEAALFDAGHPWNATLAGRWEGWACPIGMFPDRILKFMAEDVAVTNWLRCECLIDDFLQMIRRYAVVTKSEERAVRSAKTKKPQFYNHNVLDYWTLDEIAGLYEANPLWAEVERMVYASDLSSVISGNELRELLLQDSDRQIQLALAA